MSHGVHFHTVMIGTDRRAEERRIEVGMSHADFEAYVTVVKTVGDLKNAVRWRTPGEFTVVFLRGWETLENWRKLYNACIANGWAQPWNRGLS